MKVKRYSKSGEIRLNVRNVSTRTLCKTSKCDLKTCFAKMQTAPSALCPLYRPALVMMISVGLAWAEGEWPRCSPAKFKEKGTLTLSARQARADRHQRRPDEAARSWTKPSPAQLCSCLPCLAAEAVAERRREREHMRVAPEVLSTQPPCYGFSLAISKNYSCVLNIFWIHKSKFSTLNVALIWQMWKDEDWDWEEEGKGLNGLVSG